MNVDSIKQQYADLQEQLIKAVSNMTYTDQIKVIRTQLDALQATCPHNNGSFDFSTVDECPYCGKRFHHKKTTETDPDWKYGIKMY